MFQTISITNPIIVVNMKLHREAVEEMKDFIEAMVKVMERWPNVRLVLATPAMNVAHACHLCQDTPVEVWTQHLDVDGWGSSTGSASAAHARSLGATGTLLNHAERPMSVAGVKDILEGEHRPATICICAPEPQAAAGLEWSPLRWPPLHLCGREPRDGEDRVRIHFLCP